MDNTPDVLMEQAEQLWLWVEILDCFCLDKKGYLNWARTKSLVLGVEFSEYDSDIKVLRYYDERGVRSDYQVPLHKGKHYRAEPLIRLAEEVGYFDVQPGLIRVNEFHRTSLYKHRE